MGDEYELILAPRREISNISAKRFVGERALGYLEPAALKIKKKKFLPRKRLAIIDLFEELVGGGTFSSLAPVLSVGPVKEKWSCHPLPLFVAVSMIPYM